jgi:hypothetical protein
MAIPISQTQNPIEPTIRPDFLRHFARPGFLRDFARGLYDARMERAMYRFAPMHKMH